MAKPWKDKTYCIQKVTVLECVWTNIPRDVYDECSKLWKANELGNNWYYYDFDLGINPELEVFYPAISAYLKKKKLKAVLIHFWW